MVPVSPFLCVVFNNIILWVAANAYYCFFLENNHKSMSFPGMCDTCAVSSEVKEVDICSMFLTNFCLRCPLILSNRGFSFFPFFNRKYFFETFLIGNITPYIPKTEEEHSLQALGMTVPYA